MLTETILDLVAACLLDPSSRDLRGILADALEEAGHERAGYIREARIERFDMYPRKRWVKLRSSIGECHWRSERATAEADLVAQLLFVLDLQRCKCRKSAKSCKHCGGRRIATRQPSRKIRVRCGRCGSIDIDFSDMMNPQCRRCARPGQRAALDLAAL